MRKTRTSRRDFLKTSVVASGAVMASPAVASPAVMRERKPNFLYIICDQLGLDAIGAHGCKDVRTPYLDKLINTGTTFIESHSTNPVCSPARSSMMTGRMPDETGVITNGRPIHRSCPTVGHVLGASGYESVYCGKWHLPGAVPGPQEGFRVLPARGGQGDIDDTAISRTCEAYMRNRASSDPYLLVASFLQPHDICFWGNHVAGRLPEELPFAEIEDQLPELPPNVRSRPKAPAALDARARVSMQRTDLQWKYYLYVYHRMIEMLDADIGRLLEAVEDSGQADNTVICFTSDHGDGQGRHGHVSKWYPYDEAVKVPLSFTCPGLIDARQDTSHLASGVDIMSTLCDLAGVDGPERQQGRSLRPLLQGDANIEWRDFVYSEFQQKGRVIRSDDFKYVHFEDDPIEQLFDMKNDPWEMTNLYEDPAYADVLKDHRKMLADFRATLQPVAPTPSIEKPKPKRPAKKA